MLNEVKHLAFAREILRCAQNDIIHHLTCDRPVVVGWGLLPHQTSRSTLLEWFSLRKELTAGSKRSIVTA
jgi:hypothetical protein